MMEAGTIHIDGTLVIIVGASLSILLGIIAFFMSRPIKQFDILNATVQKIDRDLSLDIGVVKSEQTALKQKVEEFDPIWDRLRLIEQGVATLKAGGCDIAKRCQ